MRSDRKLILNKTFCFLMLMGPVLTASDVVRAEQSWRFLTVADWHSAESYVWQEHRPEQYREVLIQHIRQIGNINRIFGGELVLFPGDTTQTKWHTEQHRERFDPKLSLEDTILISGKRCYTGLKRAFNEGGYGRLLAAVGDHELGDNPWAAGSAAARSVPHYRQAFAKAFNLCPVTGEFRFPEKIGNVPARPMGTQFELTSYAYQHRNVLFITLDAFHQDSSEKNIGREGSVTGAVKGEHLDWLELVLQEASQILGIDHLIVQSHLPVIFPVRKITSSGMMMDNGTDTPFWGLLRRYNVDIYFAGEVHAITVNPDPKSNLVEVVTRELRLDHITTTDVEPKRLTLRVHREISSGQFELAGELVIDKSGPETRINGSGVLAPVDNKQAIIHFPFETLQKEADLNLLRGPRFDPEIMGVVCEQAFLNKGQFGEMYSAVASVKTLVEGKVGNAVEMDADSRIAIWGQGPMSWGHAVSYALWVKTTSDANQVLISSASRWSPRSPFFNLNLDNGRPQIMTRPDTTLTADNIQLNDGKWHHIAAVMPHDGCLLSEVELYADGRLLDAQLNGSDTRINVAQNAYVGIGGIGFARNPFDDDKLVKPFVGAMDELSIWVRPLTKVEIESLVNHH